MEIGDYAFHSNGFLEEMLSGKLPLKDSHAYLAYPEQQWVFHKPDLYKKQGIPCCPHGVDPREAGIKGPLFSKPATNILGLSTGAETWNREPKNLYRPGFMWMPCLDGEHISFDVYVQKGSIEHVFDLVIPSEYNANGSFLIWEKADSSLKQIEIASRFIGDYLRDWSGITNIEMIGNYILEIPLRTGTQFVDFYFPKWSQAVLELTGIKLPEENQRSQNISYVVRSPINSTLSSQSFSITPDQRQKIINLERSLDIKIYLPWKEGKALSQINHDGYSVRLAFINAPNINAARESWQHLREIAFPEADLDEIEAF